MTFDEAKNKEQYAINRLQDAKDGYKEYLTDEAIDIAIKAIEQTTWIPVSERLPEDNQEVQITYKINAKYYVWSAIWDELHCRFYDKKYRSYISVDSVIAWMPLPEPYEPQESEDKE